MKRVLVFLGTLSFVWGALLISFSFSGLTGFAISSDNSGIYSVFGLSLIIGGLILVFTGAREESSGGLEKGVETEQPRIVMSETARKKLVKDNFVRANKKKYMQEIEKIANNPNARPQELIGEFHVSPRGANQIRIAWHTGGDGTLYVDDLLYHTDQLAYSGDFNHKARRKEITRRNYGNYRDLKAA